MTAALAGKRILIVEDESVFAGNLAHALKQMGAVVLEPVRTAAEGLLTVLLGVDAAILDIRLPDGDVYSVADELSRRKKPFLFLSGVDRAAVPERFRETPFVAKPCREAAWTTALGKLLEPAGSKQPSERIRESERQTADVRAAMIARRLCSLNPLAPDEIDLLRRVGAGPANLWAPRSLIEQHASEHIAPRYVISGWAARIRELKDGRRQVVQLILPGDALQPHLRVRHSGQTVQCLTVVQTVDGSAVRLAARNITRYPGIAAAVDLAAASDRALLLNQVTRLGRQTAHERVANLFLELHDRLQPLGLVHGGGFAFPPTQESLGDLLGLSIVHVNRTLQLMRREGQITLKQGRLTLTDLPALQAIGDYTPPVLEHLG